MPEIQLKSGQIAIIPDKPTPEELAWIKENQAIGPGLDSVKSGLSGLLEGASRAPYIVGDLGNLAVRGINKLRPGSVDEKYEKLTSDRVMELLKDEGGVYSHTPQTTAGRYTNAATNAIGGTLVLGGANIAPKTIALPGTISRAKAAATRVIRTPLATAPVVGMAGELGGDIGRGFDEGKEKSGAGALTAAILTQIALMLAGRTLAPNHPKVIQDAARGMTPDDWERAAATRASLEKAGASTATLGDAVPVNSQVRGLTRDLSNATGGAALTRRLAGRTDVQTGEIPRLMDEAVNALHPTPPSVAQVTDALAERAGGAVGKAIQQRNEAYLPVLRNAPPVGQEDLTAILQALKARAQLPENLGTVDQKALETAVSAMGKTPLRSIPQAPGTALTTPGAVPNVAGPFSPLNLGANLQALSKNVKGLKQGISLDATGNLDKAAGLKAYQAADEALKGASPAYREAMGLYDDVTRQVVDPVRKGLVGQIAGLRGKNLSEATLPAVVRRSGLEEASTVLPALAETPELRGQLARVLMDRNRQPVSTATTGSQDALKLRSLAGQLVPPAARETFQLKTGAADTLSKLTAEAGMDASARAHLGQSAVATMTRFLSEMARRSNLRINEKETRILSELLATPTEKNLKILQEIAQQRPEIGEALSALQRAGAIQGGVTANKE